jgi:hypothetical protein
VEPGRERFRLADRSRLRGEDEEGGLKRVFGVRRAGEDAPADIKDHRAVTGHDDRERQFFPRLGEAREQFVVGRPLRERVINQLPNGR